MEEAKTGVLTAQVLGIPDDFALKFKSWLDGQPLSDGSKRQYMTVANAVSRKCKVDFDFLCKYIKGRAWKRAGVLYVMRFLGEFDLIKQLPSVKRMPPEPRTLINNDEFLKIITELSDEDRRVAQFLRYTGCRRSEAFNLKLKDINFQEKIAQVYVKKTTNYRVVSLPDNILKEFLSLKEQLGLLDNEYIFYRDSNASAESKAKRFLENLQRTSVETIGKKIGTHDFRRFYASYLYEKTGFDIQLVARLMGISVNTAQTYTQFATKKADIEKARSFLSEL